MPGLKSDANRFNFTALAAFKSKIQALEPMKQTSESIRRRISDSTTNRSTELVPTAIACISVMVIYVDVVIDNVDVYYYDLFNSSSGIWRRLPSEGRVHADGDMDKILQAAIKCIDIIDKHNSAK